MLVHLITYTNLTIMFFTTCFHLQEIQTEMQPRRERIYQLKQASLKLPSLESEHGSSVIARWEKLRSERQRRSSALHTAVGILENFVTTRDTEVVWITETEEQLSSEEFPRTSDEVSENRTGRFTVRRPLKGPWLVEYMVATFLIGRLNRNVYMISEDLIVMFT